MKTLIAILSVSLVSLSAQAAPMTLLQYTASNASVNPMFRLRMNCGITSDGNVSVRKINGDIAHGGTSKIIWKGIPNQTVLKSLILDAKNGKVVYKKIVPRPGAGTSEYTAYVGKTEVMLARKFGELSGTLNTSEAAARLMAFLKVNCQK